MSDIYTVRIGQDHCWPAEGYLTIAAARALAARLRAEGWRGVYILDHVSGESVR